LATILTGFTRAFLAAAVFFVPIAVMPGLVDVQELPKAALFVCLTFAAAVTWAISWMVSRDVVWRRVPGIWWLAAFTVSAIVSTAVSVNRDVSLIGFSAYLHDTLPFLLAGVGFVILAVQVFDRERDLKNLAVILGFSLGLVGLQAVLQTAGASFFPFASLQSSQLLIAGNSALATSVLMAVLILTVIATFGLLKRLVWKILAGFGGVIGLFVMLAIDAQAGWVALMVGVVLTLVAASVRPLDRWRVLLGTAAVAVALVGILTETSGVFKTKIALDVKLDQATSWSVSSEAFRDRPIFGSGPATFYYDFLTHRPVEFNQSALAGFGFVKGTDVAGTMLPTLGLAGSAAILGFVVCLFFIFIRRLESHVQRLRQEWEIGSLTVGIFGAVVAGAFFAPGMAAFMAVAWFGLAMMAILIAPDGARLSNRSMARTAGMATFLFGLLAVIVSSVWSIRLVLADRELVNVTSAIGRTENLETVVARIDRAIRYVPQNPLPYFLRAQALIVQAQLALDRQDNQAAADAFTRSVQDAQAGIAQDPRNAVLYSTYGSILKIAGTYAGDVSSAVLETYRKAVELDPNNAKNRIDLGQAAYLVAAAMKAQTDSKPEEYQAYLDEARREFERAIQLNASNMDAQFGLVVLDELVGEKDAAFDRLQRLIVANPQTAALWYELGLRQIDRQDPTSGETSFKRALTLEPNFAPPHVELGKLAESKGDKDTARQEYEAALAIDANNQEATERLEQLDAA